MSGTKGRRNSPLITRKRRGSHLGVTGKFPTTKNEACLWGDSLRELDAFLLAQFDESISQVIDHPCTIQYEHAGRPCRYTPDALFIRAGDAPSELIEVKMQYILEKEAAKLEPAFQAARAHCASNGMVFRILTDADMPATRVRNLRFLLPYAARPDGPNRDWQAEILSALDRGPRTLQTLIEASEPSGQDPGELVAQVWRLVAKRHISTDLESPLSTASVLEHKSWSVRV